MFSRCLLTIAVVSAIGVATGNSEAHAGGYSVFYVSMQKLNYKTPVPYSSVVRSGYTDDVYTTSSACLKSINSRVASMNRNGGSYESYFIVYTDKHPTTDSRTELCLLSHVASGKFGNWGGWIIYWTPAFKKGYFLNPYFEFKKYGPATAARAPGSNGAPSITLPTPRRVSHIDRPSAAPSKLWFATVEANLNGQRASQVVATRITSDCTPELLDQHHRILLKCATVNYLRV